LPSLVSKPEALIVCFRLLVCFQIDAKALPSFTRAEIVVPSVVAVVAEFVISVVLLYLYSVYMREPISLTNSEI